MKYYFLKPFFVVDHENCQLKFWYEYAGRNRLVDDPTEPVEIGNVPVGLRALSKNSAKIFFLKNREVFH